MSGSVGEQIFGDTTDVAVDPQPGGTAAGLIDEDVHGKYLLLGVPEYDVPGSSVYLRLGAAAAHAGEPQTWTAPSATGEDLAALVQGFADDNRDRVGSAPSAATSAFPQTVVSGLNGGLEESPPIAMAGRQAESAQLHSKGGWRDHSDGNRITTTRGDKIEVIRGNYKLVVLGRQQTPSIYLPDRDQAFVSMAAGVDMSGGLVDTDSGDLAAPAVTALDITYNWQQDSDGSWAWTQTTNVGSELPAPGGNSNYQIINKSWLDYQRTQTGSERKRVSFLGQETYADILWSYTHVTGTNDTVTRGKELLSLTTAPAINDITNAALATEARVVPVGIEVDLSDIIALVQVAALMTNNWVGMVFDDHLGLHSDVHAGMHAELRLGMHNDTHAILHAETHMGAHTDLHLGPHLDVHLFDHLQMEHMKLDIAGTSIKNGEEVVGTYFGSTIFYAQSDEIRTASQQALNIAAAHMKQ